MHTQECISKPNIETKSTIRSSALALQLYLSSMCRGGGSVHTLADGLANCTTRH